MVLEVAGVDTPFLYDTGAQANCMTIETYKQFEHLRTPPANGSTRIIGAGDNNLGLQTIKLLPVKYKGQTYYESFMVCANLEYNIIGMPMINQLGLSYDAHNHQIFAIDAVSDALVVTSDTLIEAHQTRFVRARFGGEVQPFTTAIAQIHHPNYSTIIGGPAITKIEDGNLCPIAITNTGPADILIKRNDLIGTLEQIPGINNPSSSKGKSSTTSSGP